MENKHNTCIDSYPMVGGEGPHSYARNSTGQRHIVEGAKILIHEAVNEKLNFDDLNINSDNSTFLITDLGCSVGPNTFIAVQNIIEAVSDKYRKTHSSNDNLQFQVFFNDSAGNDFNTLFKNLPPSRNYFSAAVPGSFHGRLFPASSLHFIHSSSALHWLSKIPDEVADSGSSAWNGESAICTGLVEEVAEAYRRQFLNDVEAFLTARAEEIVGGGMMAVMIFAMPEGMLATQTVHGRLHQILWACVNDLAKLGLTEQQKVNSFNIPLYFPTIKEMETIIQKNECFSIEKLQILPKFPSKSERNRPLDVMLLQMVVSGMRATLESLMEAHFGHEFVDHLFDYYKDKLVDSNFVFDEEICNDIDIFILLKRKMLN